jgi:hypothetical protein
LISIYRLSVKILQFLQETNLSQNKEGEKKSGISGGESRGKEQTALASSSIVLISFPTCGGCICSILPFEAYVRKNH